MSTSHVMIVDVGLGNLHSVVTAFGRAGVQARVVSSPSEIQSADRLVFPGQGAFRECAEALQAGFGEELLRWLARERPYLGICLGMQALFESSEEAPGASGLGYFSGHVIRFESGLVGSDGRALKVPHMGWNQVSGSHPLVETDEWYYFVHSFYCAPSSSAVTAATCEYTVPFCAAVAKDNVFACQFHPEKSQHAGARLIKNFLKESSWS